MPPPKEAELPLNVLLLITSVAWFSIPPPPYSVELPLSVLLLNVTVPSWLMMPPPAEIAELPLRVLLAIVTVALPPPNQLLEMAPPYQDELPLKLLPLTVSVPWSLKMPPPTPTSAALPLIVQLLNVSSA